MIFFSVWLGKDAQIDVMVDFIVAAQLAEKFAEESDESLDDTEINEEDEDVIPVAARGPEVCNVFEISCWIFLLRLSSIL